MQVASPQRDTLSTGEVADLAEVHRDTLLRWLRDGRVPEPRRDHRGWRVFTRAQAESIARFARTGELALPMDREEALQRRLDAVDWSFNEAKTDYLTHRLHPYPAKYIPQIPNLLIQELSSVGEKVCDPFCGSGTTLVEALSLKRHAVGVDASPLAVLIAKAKTVRLSIEDIEPLRMLGSRAKELGESLAVADDPRRPLLFSVDPFQSNASRPEHDGIQTWFEPFVIEELAELRCWCRNMPSESSRLAALVAFSSIIVAVSKQDSDTRYVRREKNLGPGDTFLRFSQAMAKGLEALIEFTDIAEPRFSREVFYASVLDGPDIGEVDLVVCSPPYPNAYSYHLYHRTRMEWLNMDQPAFKRDEIGSHRKYSRRGPNKATVETFAAEMHEFFEWLGRHLRNMGYASFVIGDSLIGGDVVRNVEVMSVAARDTGLFREVARVERQIARNRSAFNPHHGGDRRSEFILVLQRLPRR